MSEHSPLPWRVTRKYGDIFDASGRIVFGFGELDCPNAEFIVRAVNAYDLMRQCLESVLADKSAYQWHAAISQILWHTKAEGQ